jgi:aspartokinase/homoserine dehydrogenase 1
MRVLKFGGTSVGSVEALESVINIVKGGENAAVVVVSAFSGVTDVLIRTAKTAEAACGDIQQQAITQELSALKKRHLDCAAHFLNGAALESAAASINESIAGLGLLFDSVCILKELSPRSLDSIMSFGERISAALIAEIFRAAGLPAVYLDSRSVIKTDAHFGAASVMRNPTYHAIQSACTAGNISVAAGFIGSTERGETTTLGRGGSDLSAAVFAAALNAEMLEIWTDVNGVLTADPKIVRGAFTIPSMPYIEALEMSHFGAKVLHAPTIQPVLEKNIPIKILNTFSPTGPSTLISRDAPQAGTAIRGISSIADVCIIKVQGTGLPGVAGFASRLFGSLARRGISLILITQASSE